ncbi:MAG: PD-(D/E)XK nuclease family protein [Planctomycetota bacterium]
MHNVTPTHAESRCVALPWDAALLPQAAAWISSTCRVDGPMCDLRHVTVVLPGRRAGRNLLAQLLSTSDDVLIPPTVTTPGSLMWDDIDTDLPMATPDDVRLAWLATMREASLDDRQSIAGCLADDDTRTADAMARALTDLERDLAANRVDFDAIISAIGDGGDERFTQRWATLSRQHTAVRARLRAADLVHPMEVIADIEAMPFTNHDTIVLVGILELNPWLRARLTAHGDRVAALVHHNPDDVGAFDVLGVPRVDAWAESTPPIDDEQLIIVDQAADQARAMIDVIERLAPTHAADAMTIGLVDRSLSGMLQTHAQWSNIDLHDAEGHALVDTRPYRLLSAIADWVDDPRFATFASLLRHSDLLAWLSRELDDPNDTHAAASTWVTLLDRYYEEHLDGRLDGQWLGPQRGREALRTMHQSVTTLLEPLRGHARKSLPHWCDAVLGVLQTVYRSITDDSMSARTRSEDACLRIRDVLDRLARTPETLQPATNGSSALRLMLGALRDEHLADAAGASAIEMLGWLELHTDPAEALIMIGVHDGSIPALPAEDPLLPEGIRHQLGLPGERERVARDAYILAALTHSRRDLTFIAGRRARDGEMLVPCRYLVRTAREQRPHRILRFVDPTSLPVFASAFNASAEQSAFDIPRLPDDLPMPEKLSVTAFRDLIECPYRFALRRILKLRAPTDDMRELTGAQFGTLAHHVLRLFGEDATMIDSANPDDIRTFLLDHLETEASRTYGHTPQPAVRLQIARLRQRLEQFAPWQAARRAAGWRIIDVEWAFPEDAALDTPALGDDFALRITGSIDRIEQHIDTNAYEILDYKTSDTPADPEKSHRRNKSTWRDLQLPLYRHFALAHRISGDTTVGYVAMSRDVPMRVKPDWGADDFTDAVDYARSLIYELWNGSYHTPTRSRVQYDDFARICKSTILRATDGDDEGGDA